MLCRNVCVCVGGGGGGGAGTPAVQVGMAGGIAHASIQERLSLNVHAVYPRQLLLPCVKTLPYHGDGVLRNG